MKVRIPLILGVIGCGALVAAAKTTPMSSRSFADKAAVAGQAEIELSQLALERSQNDSVKQLAQMMITDHQAAAKQLDALAATDKIQLPKALPHTDKAAVATLRQKNGPALDRTYVDQMVRDHEQAVALFQSAAGQKGIDQNLRDFAQQTLPTLQRHLEHAQQLATQVDQSNGHAALAPHSGQRHQQTSSAR